MKRQVKWDRACVAHLRKKYPGVVFSLIPKGGGPLTLIGPRAHAMDLWGAWTVWSQPTPGALVAVDRVAHNVSEAEAVRLVVEGA